MLWVPLKQPGGRWHRWPCMSTKSCMCFLWMETLAWSSWKLTSGFPTSKRHAGQKVPRSAVPGVMLPLQQGWLLLQVPLSPQAPCTSQQAQLCQVGRRWGAHGVSHCSQLAAGSLRATKSLFMACINKRGKKGCHRRALLLAAAQARILRIISSQNHMLFFPCCWVLWIKSFRCAQFLHCPPQPKSWSQAGLDNCKADLAVNQIVLVRACACARVCTWGCVHLLLQVGRNTITLTFATSLYLQIWWRTLCNDY